MEIAKRRINIIVAHNCPSSITKLAAIYADGFDERGFDVTISYPMGNHYRFYLFQNNVSSLSTKYLYFLAKALLKSIFGREWVGRKIHKMSGRTRLNPYLVKPTRNNMPDADYLIVLQSYVLFDVIDFPKEKGTIIDSCFMCNYDDDAQIGPFWRYVTDSCYKRINVRRFASSQMVYNYFTQKGVKVDRVIHQGVKLSQFKPNVFEEKTDEIMLFCDLKEGKGFHFGRRVLEELKRQGSTNKLYSVGGNIGGLDLSIFDHVYDYLRDEEYAAVFRKHKFFIYPSLFDGFPAPPLEAMASGAVCVLARVAGVEEYAVDGHNCMLCEPGDMSAFVSKTKEVLNNHLLQRRLSENAIVTAGKFSFDTVINNLVDFIHEGGRDNL